MTIRSDTFFGWLIIRLAWGKRKEYPKQVSASWRLWLKWITNYRW